MANALSTAAGGGTTTYIDVPTCQIAGNEIWLLRLKFRSPAVFSGYHRVLGNTAGGTLDSLRLTTAGHVQLIVGGQTWISSDAGAVILGEVHELTFVSDGETIEMFVYGVPTASGAGTALWVLNAFNRARTTYTPGSELFELEIQSSTYNDIWNGANSPSSALTWTGQNGNQLTLVNSMAVDNSQWVYYEDGSAPAGYPVEILATAVITLSAEKIGQVVAGLNGAAAAAVAAHKIAQAQLAVSASAATSVTAKKIGQSLLPIAVTSAATVTASKIGAGAATLNASADINLISGNVIIVEATINFTAAASIGLSGQKHGAGSVAFLSAANSQLSASKTGNANINLTAGSLASLAGNKMGAAAASLQCAVVHSLLSSKTGYSSFTVPVSISITLNGLSAATKPVARAVFINTRSQQKSLLNTSSAQQHRLNNHSRQRYNLQSGSAHV